MKIRSDIVGEKSEGKISIVSRKILKNPIMQLSLALFLVGSVFEYLHITQNNETEKKIEHIMTDNPIIKCSGKYLFPDEYSLLNEAGSDLIKTKTESFAIDYCYVTDKTMKDNGFVKSVLKQRDLQSKRHEELIASQKPIEKEKPTEKPIIVINEIEEKKADDALVQNYDNSIHDFDYFERMEYKSKVPKLQRAYANLVKYKETHTIPKWGSEYSEELKQLNVIYNDLRARVWVLHFKYGRGSFSDLESKSVVVLKG